MARSAHRNLNVTIGVVAGWRHVRHRTGSWRAADVTGSETITTALADIAQVDHLHRAFDERIWAAFSTDPEWVEKRAASEASGVIVERIDNSLLTPTAYSALQ